MTVCRYYLQGTCRFGNRCRFEHTDPDSHSNSNYSNRRNDYGYQDRYRTQENYYDRNNKYENPELSYGPRRYNNYENPNQNYRSDKYNQYDNNESYSNFGQSNRNDSYDSSYYKEDYGRYSSPERQSSNSRFDNYQKSQFKPNNFSNKYDKNQYEWVSDDYKKQHQKKEQSYHKTPQHQSFENKTFSFKNIHGDKNEDKNEELMILVERVKEDVTAWELGNQWPFTCYSPFPKRGEFPGFKDISFEELRYEALKAQESNSFDYFVENIAKAVIDVQNRRNKLKEPTEDLLSMIERLRAGEDLSETTETTDGFSAANFTQTLSEDIADETPVNAQSSMSASSFSFKTTLDNVVPVKTGTSFSFKTILEQSANTRSALSSSFSFKVPETAISAFSSKDTDSGYTIYTPLEQLSEQDKEQFSASTFTLGKIPTVPPPKVLCF